MATNGVCGCRVALPALAVWVLAGSPACVDTQQAGGGAVALDADDIGGVVSGANGPEAGVWVVAETDALPTKFIRIVVTDEQGRYLLPDMPDASFDVFVRGYGLVDSQRVWRGRDSSCISRPWPHPTRGRRRRSIRRTSG